MANWSRAAEQAVAGHLQSCADCSSAVLEQQELKKAVRVAGKRFSAPPELYASVQKQMQPKASATVAESQRACGISGLLAVLCFRLVHSRPATQCHGGAVD